MADEKKQPLSSEGSENELKTPVAGKMTVPPINKKLMGILFLITGTVALGYSIFAHKKNSETRLVEKDQTDVIVASQVASRQGPNDFIVPTPPEMAVELRSTTPSGQQPSTTDKGNQADNTLTREQLIQMRTQLEAAQRRLTSPVQAYETKVSTADGSTPQKPATSNDPNTTFANQTINQAVATVQAQQQTVTDAKIFQGKIIPGVLDTAINSDLPGLIRATITDDVYGETGRKILLPKGTRLIGQYNSAIQTGQVRVFIIWTRAITPDQVDIAIGSPGTDALGRAGLAGSVDNHFFEIFGTSILLSVMAAGVADIETNNSDTLYGNPYQYEVVEGFSNNSEQILEKTINIKPTITIDQGTPLRIMVAQDLDFTNLPTSPGHIIYDPTK
jgi:type IV secretion system protein VirB10